MEAAEILEALPTPAGRADPYALYEEARKLGPVAAGRARSRTGYAEAKRGTLPVTLR
jgi:hypothetical protein